MEKDKKITWIIPHPSVPAKPIECSTFEECMEKWFEGHNLPKKCIDGKVEVSTRSYNRVQRYILKHKKSYR